MASLVNRGQSETAFALHCRGDVRLYRSGADCTPRSKKGPALLAVLAAEQRPLNRVKIIDLLWSDRQEEQARASLRTLLADFKEQFGEHFDALLVVERERIALGDGVRTDLTDASLVRPSGELFEGLDHIDPQLDEWLRVERAKWEGSRPSAHALPLPSSPPEAWRRVAAWLVVVGLLVTALLFLSRSYGLDWRGRAAATDLDDRLGTARALLDSGEARNALRARDLLLAEVQRHPDNPTALGYLAEATISASDHGAFAGSIALVDARREARSYGKRAIALDPKNAAAWAALGWSNFATAAGVAPFERAVALDRNNARYRTQLGRALEYQNRYDEAYFHQRRAMDLAPLSPEPVIGFLRAAVQLDRVDEMKHAVAAYEKRRPKPADLAHTRGYLALQLDDDVGCVQNLLPLAERGNRRVLSSLVTCLTLLGEIDRAAQLDSSPSLRSDVLRNNVAGVERRALTSGSDFWLRNYETLAAADLLVRSGKASVLVASFDGNYDSVAEFAREGGRIAMEPTALLLAMQMVGREKEARELRAVLARQARSQQDGMKLSTWSLLLKASVELADGRRDQAVALLERCYPDCLVGFYQTDISQSAFYGRLNDHPRFQALVARFRAALNERRAKAGLKPIPVTI